MAVVLLAATLSGCLGSSSAGEPAPVHEGGSEDADLMDAVQSWNFTGFNGSWSLVSGNLGWVDIAYARTDNARVAFEWQWTWDNQNPLREGDQSWWCLSRGVFTRSDGAGGPSGVVDCSQQVGDEHYEVRAQVANEDVEVLSTPEPLYAAFGQNNHNSTLQGGIASGGAEAVGDRPVHHIVLAAGGEPFAGPIRFEVVWENTTVNITHGPASDAFEFDPEDFNSTAQAQVDIPYIGADLPNPLSDLDYKHGDLRVQADGDLEAELVRGDRWTHFWYWPHSGIGSPGSPAWQPTKSSYQRPDGSVEEAPSVLTAEATTMPGPWSFRLGPTAMDLGDQRLVMGVRYDRALLPWEKPSWPV